MQFDSSAITVVTAQFKDLKRNYDVARRCSIMLLGELLEILGSIINGFALPLKEEHKELQFVLATSKRHERVVMIAAHSDFVLCSKF